MDNIVTVPWRKDRPQNVKQDTYNPTKDTPSAILRELFQSKHIDFTARCHWMPSSSKAYASSGWLNQFYSFLIYKPNVILQMVQMAGNI